MARPRKARIEGAEASPSDINAAIRGTMADARRAADPVPGNNGAALARIVEFFKAEHPELWASIALCPLQHGLEAMAERLR